MVLWFLANCHSDVASTHRYLAQNFNRPAPVSLLRFCNLRTKVRNIRKSQDWRYIEVQRLSTKLLDGCTLRWSATLFRPFDLSQEGLRFTHELVENDAKFRTF